MALLTRGLKCQKNICEALVVKEFEVKTGVEVEEIELTKNNDSPFDDEYEWASIKVKKSNKTRDYRISCSGNGKSFYMHLGKRDLDKIKNEAGLQ